MLGNESAALAECASRLPTSSCAALGVAKLDVLIFPRYHLPHDKYEPNLRPTFR
jgi:hypothetical protein